MINEFFDPVKAWHQAQANLTKQRIHAEMAEKEAKKLKVREAAKKRAAEALAKNPNYFKELAALSNANRKKRDNYDNQ